MKLSDKSGIHNSSRIYKLSLTVCVVLTLNLTNNAYCQCELDIILAVDAEEGVDRNFGNAVAIDGNVMFIGDNFDSSIIQHMGAVYIFKQFDSTWQEIAKLSPSDGEQSDQFGRAVDIDNNIAIVGSYRNDGAGSDHGAAYIFRYIPETDEWVEQAKLLASDGGTVDRFGFSVAICDDVAVIGAFHHFHSGGHSYPGAAYVFRSTDEGQTWELEAELLADDGMYQDYFGISIDIDGDNIIIGASQSDNNGTNSGSAYIFHYDPKAHIKWTQFQKLLPLDGSAGDSFGGRVAINGGVCAIGATRVDIVGSNTGAAYIFRYDDETQTWLEETKLTASDGGDGDYFGVVEIQGNVAIVGAPKQSMPSQEGGAVYVYQYHEDDKIWVEQGKLVASDNEPHANFGSAVAIDNTLGLVGSPNHDGGADRAGAVYTFNLLAEDDSNNNGIPDACETGIGDLNFDGFVNSADLQILLGFWGACPGEPIECLGDINGDQIVNTSDLLILFGNWG